MPSMNIDVFALSKGERSAFALGNQQHQEADRPVSASSHTHCGDGVAPNASFGGEVSRSPVPMVSARAAATAVGGSVTGSFAPLAAGLQERPSSVVPVGEPDVTAIIRDVERQRSSATDSAYAFLASLEADIEGAERTASRSAAVESRHATTSTGHERGATTGEAGPRPIEGTSQSANALSSNQTGIIGGKRPRSPNSACTHDQLAKRLRRQSKSADLSCLHCGSTGHSWSKCRTERCRDCANTHPYLRCPKIDEKLYMAEGLEILPQKGPNMALNSANVSGPPVFPSRRGPDCTSVDTSETDHRSSAVDPPMYGKVNASRLALLAAGPPDDEPPPQPVMPKANASNALPLGRPNRLESSEYSSQVMRSQHQMVMATSGQSVPRRSDRLRDSALSTSHTDAVMQPATPGTVNAGRMASGGHHAAGQLRKRAPIPVSEVVPLQAALLQSQVNVIAASQLQALPPSSVGFATSRLDEVSQGQTNLPYKLNPVSDAQMTKMHGFIMNALIVCGSQGQAPMSVEQKRLRSQAGRDAAEMLRFWLSYVER